MNRVEQAMTASRMQSWREIVVGDMLSKIGSKFADMATSVLIHWKTEVQAWE